MLATAPLHLRCAVCDPEHRWRIGAVDVGIEEANAKALLRQCAGQIHGHRAFAHTAFATAHGDDLLHAWNRLAFGYLAVAGLADAPRGRLLARRIADLDLDFIDAIELEQSFATLLGNPLTLALGEARQAEPDHGPRRV